MVDFGYDMMKQLLVTEIAKVDQIEVADYDARKKDEEVLADFRAGNTQHLVKGKSQNSSIIFIKVKMFQQYAVPEFQKGKQAPQMIWRTELNGK